MTDKKYHIFWGAVFALAIAIPVYVNSHDLFAGVWATMAGVIAGGVKEYCDMRTEGNKWDWLDFGCTCLGAVIVAVFIILLHYGKG